MNLRIEDFPLGYTPARGRPINMHLSYRERGVVSEDPTTIFGVGPNCLTSTPKIYTRNSVPIYQNYRKSTKKKSRHWT